MSLEGAKTQFGARDEYRVGCSKDCPASGRNEPRGDPEWRQHAVGGNLAHARIG
jgi:hypothetical protein